MHSDAIPRVIQHAHDVPRRAFWHKILRLVHRAEQDFFARRVKQHRGVQLVLPHAPTPMSCFISGTSSRPSRGFSHVNIRQLPRHALIERHLGSNNFPPASGIRVPFHHVLLRRRFDHLFVRGIRNCTVNVQLVDDVFLFKPPFIFRRDFRVHRRRQHAIIVEVIKVVTLAISHRNFRQKLNHSPTNIPRNDNSHRVPVVRV